MKMSKNEYGVGYIQDNFEIKSEKHGEYLAVNF